MKAVLGRPKLISYLALVLASLFAIAMVGPLQARFRAVADELRQVVQTLIQEQSGLRLEYEGISPGILQDIEMRKVRLLRPDGSLFASVDRLRLRYDAAALLSGETLEALQEIELARWQVTMDMALDQPWLAALSTGAQPGTKGLNFDLPGVLDGLMLSLSPRIKVVLADGSFELRDGERFQRVQAGVVQVLREGDNLHFSCPQLSGNIVVNSDAPLDLAVSLDGSYNRLGRVLHGTLLLSRLETPFFELVPQSLSFSWFPAKVHVQRVADGRPFDLSLDLDLQRQSLSARVAALDLPLGTVVRLRGAVDKAVLQAASIPLDLDLGLDWNVADGTMHYAGSVGADASLDVLGPTRFAARVEGDETAGRIRALSLAGAWGRANFQGQVDLASLKLNGRLDARLAASLAGREAELAGSLQADSRRLEFSADRAWYGGWSLDRLQARLAPVQGIWSLEAAAMDSLGEGLLLQASGRLTQVPTLQASLEADAWQILDDRSPVLLIPGLADALLPLAGSNARLALRSTLQVQGSHYDLQIPALRLSRQEGQVELLSFVGNWQDRSIAVREGRFNIAGLQGTLSLEGKHEGPWWQGNLELVANTLPFKASGRIAEDFSALEIGGDYGLYIRADRRDNDLSGEYRLEALPLPLAPWVGHASAAGNFAVPMDGRDWLVNIERGSVLVKGLLPGYPEAYSRLNLQGTARPGLIALDRVSYSDPLGLLEGQGTISGLGAGTALEAALNLVANGSSSEALDLRFSLEDQVVGGQIRLRNLRLARLGQKALEGGLDVQGSLSGTLQEPVLLLDTALQGARLSGVPLEASARLKVDRDRLEASTVKARMSPHSLEISRLSWTWAGSILAGEGVYNNPGLNKPVRSSFDLHLDAQDLAPSSLSLLDFPLAAKRQGDLVFSGQRQSRGWQWTERQQTVLALIRPDGRFQLSARSPLPFRGDVEGQFRGADMELLLSRLEIPVEPLAGIFNFGFFGLDKGLISGQVRIVGPVVDPSFYGTLQVKDFLGHVVLSPKPLTATVGYLILDDKELQILPVALKSGNVDVNVGGTLVLSRYDVVSYAVDIACLDPMGLEVDYAFAMLAIDGRATGRVGIYGTRNRLMIEGELQANDTILSTVTPEDPGPKGDMDIAVNLAIRSGPKVEFLFPGKDFWFLRSYIERNQLIKLGYDTATEDLVVTGDVNLRGGEVFYMQRNFYIKEAVMSLNERNKVFNPLINGRAELKVPSGDTNYRISLVFENNRLGNLAPRVLSSPPLSLVEINGLLAGVGLTGNELRDSVLVSIGDLGTRFILNELGAPLSFLREMESGARNLLGADVFSMRTGIVPVLLTEALLPLDNESDSFGKYLDNTSLLVGWYIGNAMYFEVMGQLRKVDPLTGDPGPLGVKLGVELRMEFDTPYFDLEWSFNPDDPEGLFLRDHTFTFTWSLL